MKKLETKIAKLYTLSNTIAEEYLKKFKYPWEALEGLGKFIVELGNTLNPNEYRKIGNNVWIHNSVRIPPTVCLAGPLIICENAEIRHCAFFRGKVIVGAGAVIGNSCELKNSIIFNEAQIPHYNYIGDSITGYKSHLGASSLTSNLKSDKTNISIHCTDGDIETGLKKIGAMVGDNVEVGCGSVLNPGTVIGKDSNIYPLSSVRGCVDAKSIYKCQGEVIKKEKRK